MPHLRKVALVDHQQHSSWWLKLDAAQGQSYTDPASVDSKEWLLWRGWQGRKKEWRLVDINPGQLKVVRVGQSYKSFGTSGDSGRSSAELSREAAAST